MVCNGQVLKSSALTSNRIRTIPVILSKRTCHDLPVSIDEFDLIWASPPCQRFSLATKCRGNDWEKHVDLIPITQEVLKGHPYTCIENVPLAPIRRDVVLIGTSVGLGRLERKRIFECSFFIMYPTPCQLPRWKWEQGIAGTITTTLCSKSHFYPRKRVGKKGRIPNWEAKENYGYPARAKDDGCRDWRIRSTCLF